MEEAWGIKNLLDASEDTAVFIADVKGNKILYCNHLVTLKTGKHSGNELEGLWNECRSIADQFADGRSSYKCFMKNTPFGIDKNITVVPTIWGSGVKAYAFMITDHVESKQEHEREIIFKTLGTSYFCIQTIDFDKDMVITIYLKDVANCSYIKPVIFSEWRDDLLYHYVHIDDQQNASKFLSAGFICSELEKNKNGISFNFRRRMETGEYRWTEFSLMKLRLAENSEKIVCTQKDIQSELFMNSENLEYQLIMQSLANAYRSVYLVDYRLGEYVTVKADQLIFGIPKEGLYDEILSITSELIKDEEQKKDLLEYFSTEALSNAFSFGVENIGREYKSRLSKNVDWMSIQAFKPPGLKGLENKCVITYMDITEHKRVEAQRNEINVAIDVLSSKYVAVFLVKGADYSFHTIKIPSAYRIMEHQYKNILDMFDYYLSAYVLDEYRAILRTNIDLLVFHEGGEEEITKQEYIFRNINDKWIKLVIALVPGGNDDSEFIIAFEDYDEIMEQHSLSAIYSKMMLADYENMYEYDVDDDSFYELRYDGERLIREMAQKDKNESMEFYASNMLHPDDLAIFMSACSIDTVKNCINNNKSVTHLYLRKMVNGEYHSFMYGFHYYEEYGKFRVLIMERDADKEIV